LFVVERVEEKANTHFLASAAFGVQKTWNLSVPPTGEAIASRRSLPEGR
jgi:hypothetical protein